MSALWNMGAALTGFNQGRKDYSDWIQSKEQRQAQIDFEKLKLQQAQQDAARQKDIARGYVGLVQDPIPPMPGQASQPMQPPQGPVPPQQPQQPSGLDISKLDPRVVAALAKQNPQAFQNGVKDFQQTSIPPYQSFNQPQQQQPSMIPPQPKMDWSTAVRKLQAQGINDPQTILAIMDKNQARLDAEAKQQLAMLKEQELAEYRKATIDERAAAREQRAPLVAAQTADYQSRTQDRPNRTAVLAMNAKTRAEQGGGADAGTSDGIDAAAWDRIITGHAPPARGGMYGKVMSRVAEIAKQNGMTSQQLMSASADVKSRLAAKRQFEVKSQNMERAENQLNAEIPVFEDMVDKVNAKSPPMLAKLEIAARRQMGDPLITQMDQAAEVIFREFEGIVTGNPGTLNVQDVQNAHEAYMQAQTPAQAKAAIAGMRRIIKNAKGAMKQTRDDIMGDINKQVTGGDKAPAIPAGWSVKEH